MADVSVKGITKNFGSFTAVRDLDMTFTTGKVTCLLGPSGCGKTTLMRMIAGLEQPTKGRILFGTRDVTDLSPHDRNVGMVFQYPVMYQTLSVRENIAEPLLRDKRISKQECQNRVAEMLDILDMQDLGDAFIGELDAGRRQKVAVGRAVARHSEIVLFDEPTTSVEINAKLQLIRAFKNITQRLHQTIIYVTHDQTEAMTLADHIALMKDGQIVQYDQPRQLYDSPTTVFGGSFLGNPGMNFVTAVAREDGLHASILAKPMPIPGKGSSNSGLSIGVRPEHINIHTEPVPGSVIGMLQDHSIGVAGRCLMRIKVGDDLVVAKTDLKARPTSGENVHLHIDSDAIFLFKDGERIANFTEEN